jgi:hypothetical protein
VTPEEIIALARDVGIREAARRSGKPVSTVDRWLKGGPPKERVRRVESASTSAPTDTSHEASRARDTGRDTGTPPGWRPEWRRKGEPLVPPPPRLERAPTPAEVPQDPRLDPEQNVAVHLLLAGYHPGEIAMAMGLTEWQLLAWRRDPAFREVHRAGLAEMQAIALESAPVFAAIGLEELYRIGMDRSLPANQRSYALKEYADRSGLSKTKRTELRAGDGTGKLAGLPTEQLTAQEQEIRRELELLQGGRSEAG